MNLNRTIPLFIFIISFTIYAFTSYPNLTYTDNGELAAVCTSLGVAHPTGYPLFTILGHLWTYLPISSSNIFQLNLFSSFFTALSVMVLFLNLKSIGELIKSDKFKSNIIAVSVSLCYGFVEIIWSQGIALEVYSLHLFLINLIMYFLFNYLINNNTRYLLFSVFVLALSFSNHLTTVLLIPGLLFFLLRNLNTFKKNKYLYVILFILGLLPYLFLFLNSARDPLFNWGDVSRGLDKFLYHVQGKQYQSWMFSDTMKMKENLINFFTGLPAGMNLNLILLPYGLIKLYHLNKQLLIILLLFFFTCLTYSSGYPIHDIDIYFALSLIILFIFSFVAIVNIKYKYVYLIFIFSPLINLLNYNNMDHSDDTTVPDYLEMVVEPIEDNALIISSQWDFWISAFWYEQKINNKYSDIILIEKEMLRRTWYPYQVLNWYPELKNSKPEIEAYMKQLELFESGKEYNAVLIQRSFINMLKAFIEKNKNKRPIYITVDILQTEKELASNLNVIPYGQLLKVTNEKFTYNKSQFNFNDFYSNKREYPNHLDKLIFTSASQNILNMAIHHTRIGDYPSAVHYLETSLKMDSTNQMAIKMKSEIRK